MKFINFIVWTFISLILLALLALGLAFNSSVQTAWIRNRLAKHPDWHATIDAADVHWSSTSLGNLRLERNGTIITVPHVEAQFSLKKMLREGKIEIDRLVAKDWMIDLSRQPHAADTPNAEAKAGATEEKARAAEVTPVVNAQVQVAVDHFLTSLLDELHLPCERLDGLDLEGDILVRSPFDGDPHRVHVRVEGGGFQADREGTAKFNLKTVSVDLRDGAITTVEAQGTATARIAADLTISRLSLKTQATAQGSHVPEGRTASIALQIEHDNARANYAIEVARDGKDLLGLNAGADKTSSQLRGTWHVALTDADLIYFGVDPALPHFSAKGEGMFAPGDESASAKASGALTGTIDAGATIDGVKLSREVHVGINFEATGGASSIRFDHVAVSLATDRPLLEAKTQQPAKLKYADGSFSIENPGNTWIDVSIPALPLSWLEPYTGALTLKGGAVAGHVSLKWASGGIVAESSGALIAKNASVSYAGTPLLEQVDLAAVLSARMIDGTWTAAISSLDITAAGKQLISEKGTITPAAEGQGASIKGQWTANLGALANQPGFKQLGELDALMANGDFSTTLGAGASVEATLAIRNHDATVFTGSIDASADSAGGMHFEAPIKIVNGQTNPEAMLSGTWYRDGSGGDIGITGEKMKLDDLRRLATPLAVLAKLPLSPKMLSTQANKVRDIAPFWNAWAGTFRYAFMNLETSGGLLHNVAGKLQFEGSKIVLSGIKWALDGAHINTLNGTLAFDPTLPAPYVLRAKGIVDKIDATTLFPKTEKNDSLVEGKFSLDTSYSGEGVNLPDLLSSAKQSLHITSTVGIVRILKVQVGDALHEKAAPMRDAVTSVGGAFVSLFGGKGSDVDSVNHVSKRAQAVLDFTNDPDIIEIGYDTLSLDAIVTADGSMNLENIGISAPNIRITGKGTIHAGTLPLTRRQLTLELQTGYKGEQAKRLAAIGLVRDRKDADGYLLLNEPLRFAGTLEQLDRKMWHDLLAAEMTAPESTAEAKKK